MQIKDKLTFRFTAIVAVILLVFCFAIFSLVVLHANNDFEDRLKERALNTAKLLLEVDEIDESLLKTLRKRYLQSLPHEFVRIYDERSEAIFKDDTLDIRISDEQFADIRTFGELTFKAGDRMITGMLYRESMQQYVIMASAIDVYGDKKIKNLALVLSIGYFICLIIILVSGRIFAIEAIRPIANIVYQVERITASNLHLRIDEGKGIDEIGKLAITFNKMFERLEGAFEMQKRFVSNASHELRTPLTSIRGEIEVALLKEREGKEYIDILNSILEETKKLTKLSNGLLDLAQTGTDPATLNLNTLNVDTLIEAITLETVKRHPSRTLLFELNELKEETIFVNGNEELLLSALKNIINNAFKFSRDEPVTLKVFKEHGDICFQVKDNGIGISKEDLKHVFLPFFRSDNVSNIPGHGIGLSLTQRIIHLHHGKIQIRSQEGKGTEVTVSLPIVEQSDDNSFSAVLGAAEV